MISGTQVAYSTTQLQGNRGEVDHMQRVSQGRSDGGPGVPMTPPL